MAGRSRTREPKPGIGDAQAWRGLAEPDQRLNGPGHVTDTPIDPQQKFLPTNEMDWPDFERLLVRVAREVEGLRQVRLYGTPGQAQQGLDLVGIQVPATVVGVQGKKYQKFTAAHLKKAAAKFLDDTVPFTVRKLAIGVSCHANTTGSTNELTALNTKHAGSVEFELWDQTRLSELLHDRPEIVREFFGQATAVKFCGPLAETPLPISPADAAQVAAAVARGPMEASGAQEKIDAAEQIRVTDPDAAGDLVREAQRLLDEAGFPAHARLLDESVAGILSQANRNAGAAELLIRAVWRSLDEDDLDAAATYAKRAAELAALAGDPATAAAVAAAEQAARAAEDPMGSPPDVTGIDPNLAAPHAASLHLLAAEMRLAQGQPPVTPDAATDVQKLLDDNPNLDQHTAIRLRLCLADTNGHWNDLVDAARRRKLPTDQRALTLSRHARYLVLHGQPKEADEDWDDATDQACRAKYNSDASDWLYSRRLIAMRYVFPPTEDKFHPLATALTNVGGQPPIAAAARSPRERALTALHDKKLRPAAICVQRFLRDSAVSGSWAAESDARDLLADVHTQSGDAALAAHHLILAGSAKHAHDLGLNVGDHYIDITSYLGNPTYWTEAAALRLAAAQADLAPDKDVSTITKHTLDLIERIQTRSYRDTPHQFLGPSACLAAHEALAGLAGRLTRDQAEQLLGILEPFSKVDAPGHYRYTDKSQALACTGIGQTHPDLAEQAVDQLLDLLERAAHDVPTAARRLIDAHFDHARPALERLRDGGNLDAAEILATHTPSVTPIADAEEAAESLLTETTSTATQHSVGTDAVGRSVLARALPADRRATLIRHQLDRCASPWEPVQNRRDYLLAAANLTDDLRDSDRDNLFPLALARAENSTTSEADETERMFAHPLGAFRIIGFGDDRPAAVFLAARLARTAEQRRQARDVALRLATTSDEADFWSTRALQVLIDDLAPDTLPFLAKLNWPQRSLAAIAWAQNSTHPAEYGLSFANDTDVRVRRALAEALAQVAETERTARTRQVLRNDARFSVRSALTSAADQKAPAKKAPARKAPAKKAPARKAPAKSG